MSANKAIVLVVDDIPENIDLLVGILQNDYQVQAAATGEAALALVETTPPDIILLNTVLPDLDGYEVCRRLKSDSTSKHIPIIFVTDPIAVQDELQVFALGAVDYISNPISPPVVKARLNTHLQLSDQNRALDTLVKEKTQALTNSRLQVIQRLGRAAEYKDDSTGMHVIRIGHYAQILASAAGMPEDQADMLLHAAPMHDIGMIGIPDYILNKPSKLDEDEFAIMQTHCQIGADIIGHDGGELFKMAQTVALTHHEKWNGSGYPKGLVGEEIPLVGRIVALVDVFDALTSVRPYKEKWPLHDTLEVLEMSAGEHFDPNLVKLFMEKLPHMLSAKKKYS